MHYKSNAKEYGSSDYWEERYQTDTLQGRPTSFEWYSGEWYLSKQMCQTSAETSIHFHTKSLRLHSVCI